MGKDLAQWKARVSSSWHQVRIVSVADGDYSWAGHERGFWGNPGEPEGGNGYPDLVESRIVVAGPVLSSRPWAANGAHRTERTATPSTAEVSRLMSLALTRDTDTGDSVAQQRPAR